MTPVGPPRSATRARRPEPRPTARSRRDPGRRGRRQPLPQTRPAGRPRRAAPTYRAGRPRTRLVATLAVLLVGFAAITARLVQVQVLSGDEYTAFGASQRFQSIALPAERGSIFDRNGNDLAVSLPQRTIVADPSLVDDPVGTSRQLAPLLGLDPAGLSELEGRLSSGGRFAYVARRVDDEVADSIEALALPGLTSIDEPERMAPAGDLARSLLGAVGVDNEGLSGLELQYDDLLTGDPGELVIEKDPDGRTIPAGERELKPARRGDDLVLTIDRSMQYETERALSAQVVAKGADCGTAIVSKPATGEILALANVCSDEETGEVVPVGNNMAATTVFEPGSVNKVITVAAALEEGLVTPSTEIEVPDSLWVADHRFSDAHPHPTEPYSVTRILAESSNIGTIKLGQMLGKDRLDEYLRRFGLGSTTQLDFPNESAGIMLDPDDYSGTSMGSIPIGQGISVTALQMLQAYNVIANDGIYVPPKLVMETIGADGSRAVTDRSDTQRVVSEATAARMRDMMAEVVKEGTGSRGGITGYTVAGKTGTARKPQPQGGYRNESGQFEYMATFAGFVPAERPELSIIVVIDEPGAADIFGGSVAAPVFADLAQYALRLFRIPPPLVERAPAPETAAAAAEAESPGDEGERVRAEPAATTTTTAEPPEATTTTGPGSTGSRVYPAEE